MRASAVCLMVLALSFGGAAAFENLNVSSSSSVVETKTKKKSPPTPPTEKKKKKEEGPGFQVVEVIDKRSHPAFYFKNEATVITGVVDYKAVLTLSFQDDWDPCIQAEKQVHRLVTIIQVCSTDVRFLNHYFMTSLFLVYCLPIRTIFPSKFPIRFFARLCKRRPKDTTP